jgi:hypothetical protein
MGYNDDDERTNAYKRHIYFEFANIVQHYNDTARPAHDDIDFVPATLDDLDGAEYDNDGNTVELSDDINDLVANIIAAIDYFGSFDNIPEDYDFDNYEVADSERTELFNDDDSDAIDVEFVLPTYNNSDGKFAPRFIFVRFLRPRNKPEDR